MLALFATEVRSGTVPLPLSVLRDFARGHRFGVNAFVLWLQRQLSVHGVTLAKSDMNTWPAVLRVPEAIPGRTVYTVRGQPGVGTGGTACPFDFLSVGHNVPPVRGGFARIDMPFDTYMQFCEKVTSVMSRVHVQCFQDVLQPVHALVQMLRHMGVPDLAALQALRSEFGHKLNIHVGTDSLLEQLAMRKFLLHRCNLPTARQALLDAIAQSVCMDDAEGGKDAKGGVDILGMLTAVRTVLGVSKSTCEGLFAASPHLFMVHPNNSWDVQRTMGRVLDAAASAALPAAVLRRLPHAPKESAAVKSLVRRRHTMLQAFRLGFRPCIMWSDLQTEKMPPREVFMRIAKAMHLLQTLQVALADADADAKAHAKADADADATDTEVPPACLCWAKRRGLLTDHDNISDAVFVPPTDDFEVDLGKWLYECQATQPHPDLRCARLVHLSWLTDGPYLVNTTSLKRLEKVIPQPTSLQMLHAVHISYLERNFSTMVFKHSLSDYRRFSLLKLLAMDVVTSHDAQLPGVALMHGLLLHGARAPWLADVHAPLEASEELECSVCWATTKCLVPTCGIQGHAMCGKCLREAAVVTSQALLALDSSGVAPHISSACTLRCPDNACAGHFQNRGTSDLLPPCIASTIMDLHAPGLHCASCGKSMPAKAGDGDKGTRRCVTCAKCTCVQCGGREHPGLLCPALQRVRASDILSLVKAQCCPNPECGVRTCKNRGCNHMTCVKCKTHWCWTCGQAIANMETHYVASAPCSMMGGSELARMEHRIRTMMDADPDTKAVCVEALTILHATPSLSV